MNNKDENIMTTTAAIEILRNKITENTPDNLERLIASILSEKLGIRVRRAKSGSQSGSDGGNFDDDFTLRYEAKRYLQSTNLSIRELLGEIVEVTQRKTTTDIWLLITTKTLFEQDVEKLYAAGNKEGLPVIIIDWSEGLPLLAQFFAIGGESVKDYYDDETYQLSRIIHKKLADGNQIEIVINEIKNWSAGWEIVRNDCEEYIIETFDDKGKSLHRFNQDLSVNNNFFIDRMIYKQRIKEFIIGDRRCLIIEGKEGVGKSWVLADFLNQNVGSVKVAVYLSSKSVNIQDRSLKEIIARQLEAITNKRDKEYWEKRLTSLNKGDAGHVITLVIDGIDESPSIEWFELIAEALSDEWKGKIKVIITARNRYIEDRLNIQNLSPEIDSIHISPFTRAELKEYLGNYAISIDVLSHQLVEVARNPRVAKLVVALYAENDEIESVSYPQLLLEYGRRFIASEKKSRGNNKHWKSLLKKLALEASDNLHQGKVTYSDIESSYSKICSDYESMMDDFLGSDLLKESDDFCDEYNFQVRVAEIALGLQLYDKIKSVNKNSISAYREEIIKLVEPIYGTDQIALVIATAFVLMINNNETTNDNLLVAILIEGINVQNKVYEQIDCYASFCGIKLSLYLDALEGVTLEGNNATSQILYFIIIKTYSNNYRDVLENYSSKWLSLIYTNKNTEANKEPSHQFQMNKLRDFLGSEIGSDSVTLYGETYTFVDRAKQLHLYTVGFLQKEGIIQPSIWKKIAIQNVLSSSEFYDSIRWFLLFEPEKYYENLTNIEVTCNAYDGLEPISNKLHKTLLNKLYLIADNDKHFTFSQKLGYSNKVIEEYLRDSVEQPENSPYTLTISNIERTLELSEQSVERLIWRGDKVISSTVIEIPANFINSVQMYLNETLPHLSFKVDCFINHFIDKVIAITARVSPQHITALGEKLKALVGDKEELINCYKYVTLFGNMYTQRDLPYLSEALSCLKEIIDQGQSKYAQTYSYLLVLVSYILSPLDYLRFLIQNDVSFITAELRAAIPILTAEEIDIVISEMPSDASSNKHWLLLYFLNVRNPEKISDNLGRYLLTLTSSESKGVQSLAFSLLSLSHSKLVFDYIKEHDYSWNDINNVNVQDSVSRIYFNGYLENSSEFKINKIAPWHYVECFGRFDNQINSYIVAELPRLLLNQSNIDHRSMPKVSISHPLYPETSPLHPEKIEINHADIFVPTEQLIQKHEEAEAAYEKLIRKLNNEKSFFYNALFSKDSFTPLLDSESFYERVVLNVVKDDESFEHMKHFCFGSLLAICESLIGKGDSNGEIIWFKLYQNKPNLVLYDEYGYEKLCSIPFSVESNAMSDKLKEHLFKPEIFLNDKVLFLLVNIAEQYNRHEWLFYKIASLLESNSLIDFKTAYMIKAFSTYEMQGLDECKIDGFNAPPSQRFIIKCKEINSRGKDQCHWLREFLLSEKVRIDYFILFLNSADSRWSIYLNNIIREQPGIRFSKRVQHLFIHKKAINKSVNDFERKFKNTLFTSITVDFIEPWFAA